MVKLLDVQNKTPIKWENTKMIIHVDTPNHDMDEFTYDTLPGIRQNLAEKGITDLMFPDGELYSSCNNEQKLANELNNSKYRSWEGYEAIVERLVLKFGYIRFNTEDNQYEKVLSPSDYKKVEKKLNIKHDFANLINSGQEVRIRIPNEITCFNIDREKVETHWCTSKGHRGLDIILNFDKFKNGRLKPYKGHSHYFHVLDDCGNIMKTRTNYCWITGSTIKDWYWAYDEERIYISVDSIRLD